MRIMLVGSRNCPNTAPMRHNLCRALALLGIVPEVEEVEQEGLAADDIRRGFPSPTILLDGQSVYGAPPRADLALACRVYPDGLPAAQVIAQQIKDAMSGRRRAGSIQLEASPPLAQAADESVAD